MPGHAPADFIALKDLKKNSELLDKFQLTHVIEKLEPISIVQLKGFGEFPAEEMIEKLG